MWKIISPSKEARYWTADPSNVIVNGIQNVIYYDVLVAGMTGDIFFVSCSDPRITLTPQALVCYQDGNNSFKVSLLVDLSSVYSNINATLICRGVEDFTNCDSLSPEYTVAGYSSTALSIPSSSIRYTNSSDFIGGRVIATSGSGVGHVRTITNVARDGTTDNTLITVSSAWSPAPGIGEKVRILGPLGVDPITLSWSGAGFRTSYTGNWGYYLYKANHTYKNWGSSVDSMVEVDGAMGFQNLSLFGGTTRVTWDLSGHLDNNTMNEFMFSTIGGQNQYMGYVWLTEAVESLVWVDTDIKWSQSGQVFRYVSNAYPDDIVWVLQGYLSSSIGTGYARLYDITSGAYVTNSQISVSGSNYLYQESSPISLVGGHYYRAEIGNAMASSSSCLAVNLIGRVIP